MALVAILICSHIRNIPRGPCCHFQISPVEGLVSLVGLVVLEKVSELCEERPVGVRVFCAVSREEEGVQQQVLRKDLMQQVLNLATLKMLGLGCT